MTSETKKAERRARTAALRTGEAAPAKPDPVTISRTCRNFGEPTGETEACGSCRGKVRLKVFACAVHPQGCTIAKQVPGRKCCATCPDFQA